ncbi:MAG: serine/threonine protein kinase [Microscillaceae bacterium]|nr:serine/threonine protein kinase [Microscillaceae bacterium]MDW8461761.1 serine/threonine-protein kinase [Cytophagales bacterium]
MPTNSTITHSFHYHIEKTLGEGGMGTVYLAQDLKRQRKVAIKALKPQFSVNPEIRKRFENEARLMATLFHPNIVALYDYLEVSGSIYIIMEYVQGITLEKYIQEIQGPIPEAKAIQIFKQVLDAFVYAHKKGIIHRDIKPANIMLLPKEKVKVLDFGIAKNLKEDVENLTKAGVKMGTIFYMSPEQVRGEELDQRSDIYSLGITLFEMLTGRNPYQHYDSEFEISQLIINQALPKAKYFYPRVSDFMQDIIDRATAKNPQERFPTVEAMRNALLKKEAILPANTSTKEWIFEPKTNTQHEIVLETISKIEKPSSQAETDKAISPKATETNAQPIPHKNAMSEEKILLENKFGKITTQKLIFYKGLDLFEKGKLESIDIAKVEKASFKVHREYATGLFLLGMAVYLWLIAFHWSIFFLSLLVVLLALLCFLPFPTVIIQQIDGKRNVMRSWPWHNRKASEYVLVLNEWQQVKEFEK